MSMWSALRRDLGEFVNTLAEESTSAFKSLDENFASSFHESGIDGINSADSIDGNPPGGIMVDGEYVPLPPSSTHQSALFFSQNAKFKAEALAVLPETYTTPLEENKDEKQSEEQEEIKAYKSTFNIDSKTESIAEILSSSAAIKELFEELVPVTITYNEFWCRHFYRCDEKRISLVLKKVAEEKERKRKVILDEVSSKVKATVTKGKDTVSKGVNAVIGLSSKRNAKKSAYAAESEADEEEVGGWDDGDDDDDDSEEEINYETSPIEQIKILGEALRKSEDERDVKLLEKEKEIKILKERLVDAEAGGEKKVAVAKPDTDDDASASDAKSVEEIAKLKEALDNKEAELVKTLAEIELWKGKADDSESASDAKSVEEIAKLKEALDNKEAELVKTLAEIELWKGRAQKCKEDRNKVVDQKLAVDAQLTEVTEQAKTSDDRVAEVEGELRGMLDTIDKLSNLNDKLTNHNVELERALEAAKSRAHSPASNSSGVMVGGGDSLNSLVVEGRMEKPVAVGNEQDDEEEEEDWGERDDGDGDGWGEEEDIAEVER